jgi:outer membrane protein assembly factor BamB
MAGRVSATVLAAAIALALVPGCSSDQAADPPPGTTAAGGTGSDRGPSTRPAAAEGTLDPVAPSGRATPVGGAAPESAPEERWRYRCGGQVCGLAADATSVYVQVLEPDGGAAAGRLVALDPKTGEERWKVDPSPSVADGDVQPTGRVVLLHEARGAAAGVGRVEARDPRTGKVRWRHDLTWTGLVVGGGLVMATEHSSSGIPASTVLVDEDDGTVRWRALGYPEAACAGVVLITRGDGTGVGRLVAVDQRRGTERWSRPSTADDGAPTCDGTTAFRRVAAGVSALDARTGKRRWTRPLKDVRSPLVQAGDGVVLVRTARGLDALHADSGEPAWSIPEAQLGTPEGPETTAGEIFWTVAAPHLAVTTGEAGPLLFRTDTGEVVGGDVTWAEVAGWAREGPFRNDGKTLALLDPTTFRPRWSLPAPAGDVPRGRHLAVASAGTVVLRTGMADEVVGLR